jgi:hypothetical protein
VTPVARRITQPPQSVEIDEDWITEWVAYGFREMRAYLQKWAAFDQYLIRTNRKEQP